MGARALENGGSERRAFHARAYRRRAAVSGTSRRP
jgi:hypothetical protein